jgi:hypothetical protein
MYVCMCVYIYVYIYNQYKEEDHTDDAVEGEVYMDRKVHLYVYISLYVCMYVCVYISMYIYIISIRKIIQTTQ